MESLSNYLEAPIIQLLTYFSLSKVRLFIQALSKLYLNIERPCVIAQSILQKVPTIASYRSLDGAQLLWP